MHQLNDLYPEDKKECYKLLHSQLKALLDNEINVIPNLSNTSALLNGALKDINWVGFYLIHNEELLLGPFQGKPACIHIKIGKGVCGTAVFKNEVQVVKDVHEFSGHIPCDSASKSEIVIPIHFSEKVIGVLDIDSPVLNRFDEMDKEGLEELVKLLEHGCNWTNFKMG
ncbi:GAF domain-containing protein [Mobilisporobacter senegalensis]|uniref:GAF domain-containing protein n=1 Tax=Mobilisporobacter senegalensis TaxID=1329262 RepID=A0A3N1XRI9_9FIRM|nr:GAF domain-containing protein [Mobilisporobacter senegalensis]ROR29284.1 GAF domain-containing protein [Mobilisporobacter senegalensis]